jgi:hypothetical protein
LLAVLFRCVTESRRKSAEDSFFDIFKQQSVGKTQMLGVQSRSVHLASKTVHFMGCFQRLGRLRAIESSGFMERAMGIEPTSEAWEALNETLKAIELAALSFPSDGLNWKLNGN